MVSLNTILAIGGLGAAYLIFKNLGGAAGIGSSIGQGFNVFGSNIAAGLNIGSEAIKNANKFDNPLNTSVPEGFRIDPTETRNYEDYINYKDDSPVDDSFVPFVFTPPTTAPPTVPVNFMDQFTFADRPISRPTTPAITYGPLPPFAGTLEYVVQQQYEGPQLPAYAGALDYLYGNNV